MSKDYSKSRYFAISGIGYGKGDHPAEAVENYVESQLRNIPAKSTIFGTKAKFEEALRSADFQPLVWKAPEGATGFVLGMGLQWEMSDGRYVPAIEDEQLLCSVCAEPPAGHDTVDHEFTARRL